MSPNPLLVQYAAVQFDKVAGGTTSMAHLGPKAGRTSPL